MLYIVLCRAASCGTFMLSFVFACQSFLVVFLSCCLLLCMKKKGKTNESSLYAADDSAVLGNQICGLFIVCKILLGSSCVLDRKQGPSSHCIV